MATAPSTKSTATRPAPTSTYRPRVTLTRTYGVYRVESEQRPGVTYRADAVLGACDCPAGQYNKACKHVALAVRVWEMHHALRLAARQRTVTATTHVKAAPTAALDAQLAAAAQILAIKRRALADADPQDDMRAVLLRAVDQAERAVAALGASAMRAA